MATTAAVASSFSTSIRSLNCIRSKNWPSDSLLKVASTRTIQVASISHLLGLEISSISALSNTRRVPRRITAAVAQEEAAETEPAPLQEEVDREEIQDVVFTNGVGGPEEGGQNPPVDTVATKLYFGNLPYNCDSAQLAGIIQEYASPELVEVLYDRDTGRSRGFAFVTMSTVEDCNKVIENLDGREYGGRTLRVNFSAKPKPKAPLYPETEFKLFVGNLSWSVTSESLAQAFQEYGNVVGARVLYDGETGRSRGYGFVSFETKAEMDAALESLNGVELEGRSMRVSLAQGKK